MIFNNIQLEQGACSRYKNNKNVNHCIVIIFDNIESEKGACGRYKEE